MIRHFCSAAILRVRTGIRKARNSAISELIMLYLQLVWLSRTEIVFEPHVSYDRARNDLPCIIATWHGQNYLLPFVRQRGDKVGALVSRHRDGELLIRVLKRLGYEVIRGSGAGPAKGEMLRKGGPAALAKMLEMLTSGHSVALIADVPKIAPQSGERDTKAIVRFGSTDHTRCRSRQ